MNKQNKRKRVFNNQYEPKYNNYKKHNTMTSIDILSNEIKNINNRVSIIESHNTHIMTCIGEIYVELKRKNLNIDYIKTKIHTIELYMNTENKTQIYNNCPTYIS
jgi:hypothetical protein